MMGIFVDEMHTRVRYIIWSIQSHTGKVTYPNAWPTEQGEHDLQCSQMFYHNPANPLSCWQPLAVIVIRETYSCNRIKVARKFSFLDRDQV